MRHPRLAFLLLVLAMAKNDLWKLMPVDMQAHVWNASSAALAASLLGLLGMAFSSAEVWLVVALAAGFELQVAACSVAYLVKPWPMKPGDELCSAGLHFPLGLVGLWAGVCVALFLRGFYGKRKS